VHGFERFRRPFWVYLHRPLKDGNNMSLLKIRYPPIRLYSPITWKTVILNVNILHFPCIISLLYSLNQSNNILFNKYTILNYNEKCILPNKCIWLLCNSFEVCYFAVFCELRVESVWYARWLLYRCLAT